jgi:4-amino-4-deoxy-L-arabinose transferase-like glycosyltransferase
MSKTYLKVKDSQRDTVIILAVLVVISIITRLLFMGRHLEGWDSIDFALGLHDYDIAYYQPHFPGYPVYMSFCWLVHLFTDNDVLALTIPGAVFGSITLVPLFYLARRMFAEKVAWLAVFLYIVNPLCWLQSEKALSDAVGLFFVIVSVQLLFYASTSRANTLRYLVSGSVMLGICLGVRLSYFPFVILLFYTLYVLSKSDAWKKAIGYGVFAFIIGICVWLIPLSCYTGLKPLMLNGFSFTSGHFSDWGGSVATSQNVLSRFSDFVWCLFCNGLGFWCYDTTVIRIMPSIIMGIGIIFYLRYLKYSGFDYKTRFITFYMLPYFLWVFFGQNLEKPRHVLPLIPVIIICISAGLVRLRYYLYSYSNLNKFRHRFFSLYHLFIGILIVSMSIISIKLVYTHKNEPVAQIQLLDYVGHNYDDKSTRIYCWETKRFFEYYAPLLDTRRARDIYDLRYDIGASLVAPEVILSTSKVNGIDSITNNAKVVVGFKNNRYINNPYHELTLYRLKN